MFSGCRGGFGGCFDDCRDAPVVRLVYRSGALAVHLAGHHGGLVLRLGDPHAALGAHLGAQHGFLVGSRGAPVRSRGTLGVFLCGHRGALEDFL